MEELTKKEIIVTLDALYTAASAVKGRDAIKLFLRDLLTSSERIMLGRRIIIARMLIMGTTEDEIAERLRVGRGTVWRVRRWLHDQFPGYEKAIAEMEREYERRSEKSTRLITPFSPAWMRRRYPLMFWFIPAQSRKRRSITDIYPH